MGLHTKVKNPNAPPFWEEDVGLFVLFTTKLLLSVCQTDVQTVDSHTRLGFYFLLKPGSIFSSEYL